MTRKRKSPRARKRSSGRSREARSDGPIRTCLGCRGQRPQRELIRFVRAARGGIRIGRTHPGRGFYVCARSECVARLERGLKKWFPAGEREAIRARLEAAAREEEAGGSVS
ncbi:MAG: YlxR family protein [Candidatus Eisenbacteria bacterium]|nr:YlxR family protein [Candidatus Eisenbacteria bacterium]